MLNKYCGNVGAAALMIFWVGTEDRKLGIYINSTSLVFLWGVDFDNERSSLSSFSFFHCSDDCGIPWAWSPRPKVEAKAVFS